jgi:hypothetical protein
MKTEDRRVNAEMCKALVQQNLTDEEAESVLDHLYCLATVIADAFLEQQKPVSVSDVQSLQFGNEAQASPVRVV